MATFATGVGLVLKNGDVSINAYVRFSLYYHNRDCPAPVSGWPCWLRPAFSMVVGASSCGDSGAHTTSQCAGAMGDSAVVH